MRLLLGDRAAGIIDGGDGGVEVVGVEQDERSTGLDVLAETETPTSPSPSGVWMPSVGRRIVGEPPAEGRAVEVLGRIHIGDCDPDIVDCVVHGRH